MAGRHSRVDQTRHDLDRYRIRGRLFEPVSQQRERGATHHRLVDRQRRQCGHHEARQVDVVESNERQIGRKPQPGVTRQLHERDHDEIRDAEDGGDGRVPLDVVDAKDSGRFGVDVAAVDQAGWQTVRREGFRIARPAILDARIADAPRAEQCDLAMAGRDEMLDRHLCAHDVVDHDRIDGIAFGVPVDQDDRAPRTANQVDLPGVQLRAEEEGCVAAAVSDYRRESEQLALVVDAHRRLPDLSSVLRAGDGDGARDGGVEAICFRIVAAVDLADDGDAERSAEPSLDRLEGAIPAAFNRFGHSLSEFRLDPGIQSQHKRHVASRGAGQGCDLRDSYRMLLSHERTPSVSGCRFVQPKA